MKVLENKNIIISATFVACAIFFLVASYWIPTVAFEDTQIGPRFFPRMLLIFIFLLNIILIIKSNKYFSDYIQSKENTKSFRRRFIGTIIASLAFGFLFNWLGAYIAIFIFVFAFLLIWDIRKPLILIVTPISTSLGVYLVFHKLLEVRLPKGIFGSLL